jgi:hypothetical protein
VGVNTVTITTFIESTTFENKVSINIVDNKEFTNKNTYVARWTGIPEHLWRTTKTLDHANFTRTIHAIE